MSTTLCIRGRQAATVLYLACGCVVALGGACSDGALPGDASSVSDGMLSDGGDDSLEDAGVDASSDSGTSEAWADRTTEQDAGPGLACNSCHGSVNGSAPPADLDGNWSTDSRGVGAHQSHVTAPSSWHRTIDCADCHINPTHMDDPGHMDTDLPAEVVFGGVAQSNGAFPVFNGTSCQGVYCHGATLLPGGTDREPEWTTVDGTQSECGSCHGLPPGEPHIQGETCFGCHPTIDTTQTFIDPSSHINGVVDLDLRGVTCSSCHGSGTDPAPPIDLDGGTDVSRRGVGAHQSHLQASIWRASIDCDACHLTPTELWAPGHIDTPPPAELTFGALAQSDGADPSFDGTRCVDVYCHGETLLPGGLRTKPTWTLVDGSQSECGTCHGMPPGGEHPPAADCMNCHENVDAAWGITDPETHIDGVVNIAGFSCTGCHGLTGAGSAPPFDSEGGMATSRRGVGAHQSHMRPATWRATIACDQCHVVPFTPGQTGHLDTTLPTDPADLSFGHLAVADDANPAFNGTTCTDVYCHGATLEPGGSVDEPVWTRVDGSQSTCGTCHALPPGGVHPVLDDCDQCHPTLDDKRIIIDPARHINGVADMVDFTCTTCHGSENAAPPTDTAGFSGTALPSVGAHQSHLGTSDWHADLTCQQCHLVPNAVTDRGHTDTALPAEVIWGPLALEDSATPDWNGTRCTGAYCHGATLMPGGTETAPAWTTVDGTQSECGTCHGLPPEGSHPNAPQCEWCHDEVMASAFVFRDRTLHIDGVVQGVRLHTPGWEQPEAHGAIVNESGFASCQECHGLALDGGTSNLSCQEGCHSPNWTQNCTMCHGGQLNDTGAPPYANRGQTSRTDVTVGAHTEHVVDTLLHVGRSCSTCHIEPTSIFSSGHIDGDGVAEVTFGPLNPEGRYDPDTAECANLWCHGNGSWRFGGAQWDADPTLACDSCHGSTRAALSSRHRHGFSCATCHPDVVASDTSILDITLHVNGEVDLGDYFWDPEANAGRGRPRGHGCH